MLVILYSPPFPYALFLEMTLDCSLTNFQIAQLITNISMREMSVNSQELLIHLFGVHSTRVVWSGELFNFRRYPRPDICLIWPTSFLFYPDAVRIFIVLSGKMKMWPQLCPRN